MKKYADSIPMHPITETIKPDMIMIFRILRSLFFLFNYSTVSLLATLYTEIL